MTVCVLCITVEGLDYGDHTVRVRAARAEGDAAEARVMPERGGLQLPFYRGPPRPARRALPAPRPVPRPPRPPRTWLRTPTVRSSLRRPVLSQRRGRGETRLVSRYARSAWEVKRLHSAALSG